MQCRLWFRPEPSAGCAASTCLIGDPVTSIIRELNYVAHFFVAKLCESVNERREIAAHREILDV